MPRSIAEILAEARTQDPPARIRRETWQAMQAAQCSSTCVRRGSGPVRRRFPAALLIDRNHLEWRLDPASEARIQRSRRTTRSRYVMACQEGYSSSLGGGHPRRHRFAQDR